MNKLVLPLGKSLSKSKSVSSGTGLGAQLLFCTPRQEVPKHEHENGGFFVLLAGDISTEGSSGKQTAQPLAPQFCPPHQDAAIDIGPNGLVALSLEFTPGWLEMVDLKTPSFGERPVALDNFAKLEILRLSLDCQEGSIYESELESRVLQLLGDWGAPFFRSERAPAWLSQAEDRIRASFRETLSLRQLAFDIGIHPVHLARVFRQKHRQTIGAFVKTLRLIEAHRLIMQGSSLGEAASTVGFADQSQLTRGYSELFGIVPSRVKSSRKLVLSAP